MPLVDDPLQNPTQLRGFQPLPPPLEDQRPKPPKPGEEPSLGDALGAAIRSSNSVGSFLSRAEDTGGVSNDYTDPSYSAWDEVAGTKYEQYWKGTFAHSNNKAFTEALKRHIDRQDDDQRTLATSGWRGTAAGLAAGVVDPLLYVPVGGEVTGARGVWTLGRGAVSGARAGAVGMALQEGALQATQDTRTAEESAINIGGGAVLGALIGGGAAALFSRPEQAAAAEGLAKLDEPIEPMPGSVGAAAAQGFNINDLTIAGRGTEGIAKATAMTPNLRGNFREAPLARQTYQELADNPLFQQAHAEGRSIGTSVETNMHVSLGETLDQAIPEHRAIWAEAKKDPDLGLSASQFDEAVGRAMRTGDEGDHPAVTKAAEMWRSKVLDPLAQQAIDVGHLVPEDLDVQEAPSYFSRVYNQQAMIAKRPEFLDIATNWLNEQMKNGYAAQSERLQTRTQRLDQEASDLQLSPEERTAHLDTLAAHTAALEEASPHHVALQSKINAEQTKLRAATDPEAKAEIRQRINTLREGGGPEFKDYLKARRDISQRKRGLNFNVPGLAEKHAKLEQQISDVRETNQRALTRLLAKGEKVAKELGKYDEEKRLKTITDLRTQFHQMIEASNAAQDRLAKALESLKDMPAEAQTRLEKAAAEEKGRFERLNKLDDRLQVAEGLDTQASQAEVKAAVQEMIKEISDKTLSRGERVKAWRDRQVALDPAKVQARLETVEQMKKDLHREFADRWETERLGKEVTTENLPPVKEGDVRLYHGGRDGEPGEWISTDRKYAEQYAKQAGKDARVYYLDLPKNDPRLEHIALNDFKTAASFALKPKEQKLLRPIQSRSGLDFSDHARDLAVDLHNRIVGNDYGSGVVDPEFRLPITRGPLRDRTFHIPDKDILDFLEHNVVKVGTKYARRMASQIELTRKFGDVNLAQRIDDIEKQYDQLMDAAKSEKERVKIDADRKGAISDIQALRDLNLGTYLAKENASTAARLVRGLMNFNYIRMMGGVALPSLSDIMGPALIHGLGRYMGNAADLLVNIDKLGPLVKEAKYAGVAENLTHHRLLTMAEIGDPYARGTAVERWLENGTHVASTWNGLNMLTNFEKDFSAIIVQDRLNKAIMRGNDKKWLAWAGIDDDYRGVLKQYLQAHADEVGGVLVAHTDKWDNFDAVRAYRAAISRSVNSDIVTRGIGDIPLAWYRPMYRLLTQFRTFNVAAHQRMFLRATQLPKMQFISGMIGLTTIGMLSTVLRAWRSGQDGWDKFKASAHNPGFMIGEGLDQTGLYTLPIELGNITEKMTGLAGYSFNPAKTPLLVAGRFIRPDASLQGNTQKYATTGPWAAILGPSAGLVEDSLAAGGGALNAARGAPVSKHEKRAATRIVPYNSYPGVREGLNMLLDHNQ